MTANRIFYSLVLLCALVFLIFYNRSFSMFLFVFLLCLPLCSFLFRLPVQRQLKAAFVPPTGVVHACSRFTCTLRIQNHAHLPAGNLLLRLVCQNTLTGEHLRQTFSIPVSYGESSVYLPLLSPYCGSLSVTVKRAYLCDLLGLWRHRYHPLETTLKLPIFPAEQTWPPFPGGLFSSETEEDSPAYDRMHPGSDQSEPFGIRPYRPGDRLHAIHWKLSAKHGKLTVREGSLPLPAGPEILVDLQQATPAALSSCAETALALSNMLLKAGYRHRLLWANGLEPICCRISSEDTAADAAQMLLAAKPHTGGEALADFMPRTGPLLYVTSGTLPSGFPCENATAFFCGAPPSNVGQNQIVVIPGHLSESFKRFIRTMEAEP